MTPTIITCAVTGGDDAVLEKHPRIPKTPNEIAEACLAAAEAGASIVHIHVRDPETGLSCNELDLYGQVMEQIRAANREVIINLTGGVDCDIAFVRDKFPPEIDVEETTMLAPKERIRHILELKPDMASLDVGIVGDEDVFYYIRPSEAKLMAEAMRDAGVKPELECFDLSHVEVALKLVGDGVVEEPPLFQICLGTSIGAPANQIALQAMIYRLPPNAVWAAFGCGRSQMPMVATVANLGGQVRVGLEDNIYLRKGVLADNQSLVRNAADIIDRLGYAIATPLEARERLGLRAAG